MIERRHLLLLPVLVCAPAATLLSASPVLAETKKKGGGDGYTQFPTISVFTDADRSRHGTMSVDLGLYSNDPKLVAQIKLYMPRLQDAYVSVLQGYGGTLSRTSVVDTDYISLQLQTVTDRILQVHGAKVLLGSILLN